MLDVFQGAPALSRPYVLPRRGDEPGRKLVLFGVVRSTDGSPLAGAALDLWQANGIGEYSHFHPDVPEYHLRGRLTTNDEGQFEVETVVPSCYDIPLTGATGRLLAALGQQVPDPVTCTSSSATRTRLHSPPRSISTTTRASTPTWSTQ